MGPDIFYGLSRAELKKRIDGFVDLDNRSLPKRAKVFAAVAKIQGFDQLPDIVTPEVLQSMISSGHVTELQRGLSSNSGVPALLYATELLSGPLYPGTLSAVGHGIYLAATSVDYPHHPAFPRISRVAHEYAKKSHPGIIVRCGLKEDARVVDYEGLTHYMRDNRNRAKEVGITDLGAFAASLGIDGYYCDGICGPHPEQVWIVVNRKSLVFQNTALQVSPQTLI
jgi:hypothetical protein